MRALVVAAAIGAAAAPAAQSASSARQPVVVVAAKSYRLLAWDSGRKICVQMVAAGHSSSRCGSPRALSFVQFPYALGATTFVGGATSSRARTVDVVFANGAALHVRARAGRRYHGRLQGRVRFFAGREKTVSTVSSLTAKDAAGHTVQTMQVAPPPPPQPPPPPPPPPNPCGCPPTPTMSRPCPLACPYAEPAWTYNW